MMTFSEFETFLKKAFPDVTEGQLERFRRLEAGYRNWNAKINVISRKDIDNLYDHHVLHSLAIAEYLRLHAPQEYSRLRAPLPRDGNPAQILDLGTGGGFPGIPLAILFPSAIFTLCDSVRKKTRVAGEIVKMLELPNATIINARAETLPGCFDYVVSRAVASLADFYPWVKEKYSKSILYLRGGEAEAELRQLERQFHLPEGSVRAWPADTWLKDDWSAGKFVVEIFANQNKTLKFAIPWKNNKIKI